MKEFINENPDCITAISVASIIVGGILVLAFMLAQPSTLIYQLILGVK